MHKPKTNKLNKLHIHYITADVLSSLTGRRVEFQHNICVVAADKEGAISKECDILRPENHKLPHGRAKILPW